MSVVKLNKGVKKVQLSLDKEQVEWIIIRALKIYADMSSPVVGTKSAMDRLEMFGAFIPEEVRKAFLENGEAELKRREKALALASVLQAQVDAA
jgi:hypothetical protein